MVVRYFFVHPCRCCKVDQKKIKTLWSGQKSWLISEMPFPNARSRIALLLEQLFQGDFIRVKTLLTSGKENP